jgi:hypothetical protein
MAIITGQHPAVTEFLKALGIDRPRIHTVILTILPDEVVSIEVRYFVEDKELKELGKEIIKYELHEKDEDERN